MVHITFSYLFNGKDAVTNTVQPATHVVVSNNISLTEHIPLQKPLYPMAMEITFHTARIYWTIVHNATNETYSVSLYTLLDDTDTIISNRTVELEELNDCGNMIYMEPCLLLTDLESGTTYYYTVIATRGSDSKASVKASFTTKEYGKLAMHIV